MKYLITNETYSKAKAFNKGIKNMLPLLEYIQNFNTWQDLLNLNKE